MNSTEFTKICGVLLTVALVVTLSNVIANKILPEQRDEVRAYVVGATEAEPQEAPGAAAAGDTEPAEAPMGVAAIAFDTGQKPMLGLKCGAVHGGGEGGLVNPL